MYIELVWKDNKIREQRVVQKFKGNEISVSKVFYLYLYSFKKRELKSCSITIKIYLLN
jgi:hypothetical protein